MDRRNFGKILAAMGVSFSTGNLSAKTIESNFDFSVSMTDDKIKVFCKSVEKKSKIMFIADSHISYSEGLSDPYLDYAWRMHKAFENKPKIESLAMAFKTAERQNFDLIILGGDIINFPSDYNVKKLCDVISASKVPVKYISGNHDWHFEGSGTNIPQTEVRKQWMHKLKPLFFGEDCDAHKTVVNNVKFIFIDDSAHDISEKQLEWLKKELSDGMPAIISIHIPIFIEGRPYAIGDPNWGEKTDRSYKVERRKKRPEKQSAQTFEFRSLVLNSPNMLGILAGHTHKLAYDYINGKFQAVAPRFIDKSEFITLEISPMK